MLHAHEQKPVHVTTDDLALAKHANEHGWSAGQEIDFDQAPHPARADRRPRRRAASPISEVTCFLNNIGLGYQFAAAGAVVYRKAKGSGLGHELPTEWFTETVHP